MRVKLSATVIIMACVILLIPGAANGKAWKGIVPLHSTRADVERLLGPPGLDDSGYDIDDARVSITYSFQGCQEGLPVGWKVAPNTVVSISVSSIGEVTLSDVLVAGRNYDQIYRVHTPRAVDYVDVQEGVRYVTTEGEVQTIMNLASKAEKKGLPGADIHHEVYYKGRSCGKIVYDSKNRRDWKAEYASKLRSDQTEAGAEHAILSTNVFPRGEKELCLRDDVIVASPARVKYLVQLLRDRLVDMHIRNLSVEERTGKMAQLYQLIASPAFKQKLKEVDRLGDELLELDVEESRAHQNVWKKRGLLMKRLKNMTSEIDTEISAASSDAP